jgi:hypothetical protein
MDMSKGINDGSVRWIHEVKVEGAIAFRAGRQGERLIAVWPGLGTLTCARDGSAAAFAPVEGASPRAVSKLRQAQVRGLLRDLAGQLAVHASAVAIEGHTVLFLGSDGAGKSTAAAEMCLLHGAEMLADDAALLDVTENRAHVLPSEDHHWLAVDSCAALGLVPGLHEPQSKRELQACHVAREARPLAMIVALRFDPTLVTGGSLRRVRGTDAARLLLEAVIRFDIEDATARGRELEQLLTVYKCVPFFELARPSESPGGVAQYVLDALRGAKS